MLKQVCAYSKLYIHLSNILPSANDEELHLTSSSEEAASEPIDIISEPTVRPDSSEPVG